MNVTELHMIKFTKDGYLKPVPQQIMILTDHHLQQLIWGKIQKTPTIYLSKRAMYFFTCESTG